MTVEVGTGGGGWQELGPLCPFLPAWKSRRYDGSRATMSEVILCLGKGGSERPPEARGQSLLSHVFIQSYFTLLLKILKNDLKNLAK